MSYETQAGRWYAHLIAAVEAGEIAAALEMLLALEPSAERIDCLRRIAEDLDADLDLDLTNALVERMDHLYVVVFDITYPLVSNLALANIPDRVNAFLQAHKAARELADRLTDTPKLAPSLNRAIFLIRALERLLGVV